MWTSVLSLALPSLVTFTWYSKDKVWIGACDWYSKLLYLFFFGRTILYYFLS